MVSLAARSEAPVKKRVPVLDGIRGICALGVVFTHVAFATFVRSSADGPKHHSIWSILAAGQLSIGPFFIMSALLLYRPFARRTFAGTAHPDLGTFYIRRAARILPAFWLVVTFDLLVLNLSALHSLWDVLRPYSLMHIYNYHYYAGMDVLWTVPTEVQFYLALPVIALIMNWIGRTTSDPVKKAQRMMIPPAVLVVVQFAWTLYLHTHYSFWPSQYFFPMGIAGLFAIGMGLAVLSVLGEVRPDKKPALFRWATERPNLFWLAAIAFYALNCAQPWGVAGAADWQTAPAALVRDVCLLGFSFLIMVPLVVPNASSPFMNTILGNPIIVYLGRISYGIYLWHFSMMYLRFHSGSAFGKIIPVQMMLGKYGFWEAVIPVLLMTIAAASVSYFILERPLIRLSERIVRTPPVGSGPASPPRQGPRLDASGLLVAPADSSPGAGTGRRP